MQFSLQEFTLKLIENRLNTGLLELNNLIKLSGTGFASKAQHTDLDLQISQNSRPNRGSDIRNNKEDKLQFHQMKLLNKNRLKYK